MTSPVFAEPGVFGVHRPVLLLPCGIAGHLTPTELEAIVAHELCHVRRRDNLATSIHMGVEALFWFHPLVWWLGARLLEARERACDEEVLLRGNEPQAYAEGILKICELYLDSPLPCVSGVTGANLRKRIEEIVSKRIGLKLSFAKKVALAVAGAAALAVPILVGFLEAPAVEAQASAPGTPRFEVASIKPAARCVPSSAVTPGRVNLCGALTYFIQASYDLFTSDRGFNRSAMQNFWTVNIKGLPPGSPPKVTRSRRKRGVIPPTWS